MLALNQARRGWMMRRDKTFNWPCIPIMKPPKAPPIAKPRVSQPTDTPTPKDWRTLTRNDSVSLPPSNDPFQVSTEFSPGFADWLGRSNVSLACTTYVSNQLIFLGRDAN